MPVAALKTRFNAAAADGVVTDAEADGLIRSAAAQNLTRAETRELKRELGSDGFEPNARTRMQRFVAAGAQPYQTHDPRVMKSDRSTVRYSPATGRLFKSGP